MPDLLILVKSNRPIRNWSCQNTRAAVLANNLLLTKKNAARLMVIEKCPELTRSRSPWQNPFAERLAVPN